LSSKPSTKWLQRLFLLLTALVFTAGLMFASVEAPRAVDRLLGEKVGSLDVATGQDGMSDYKTEIFLSHYHIRLIGYTCLGLVLVMIAAGFALEKRGLASAGAVILFIPAFGHFAATMFFLGGLAFLRFLWLPFLDVSFDVTRLGDIAVLPYQWVLDAFELAGINLYEELPFIITGLGIFIFAAGVLAWMRGRMKNQDVADFWIYRISRHPQYLGWIIWSYGILFLPGPNIKQYVSVGNTLPWLLSAMIIIGVAMLEERKMKREFGRGYSDYRKRAPFLFPLPRFVRKIFSLPVKVLFGKEYPERKREVAAVLAFYTVLCVILSAFSSGMISGGNPVRPSGENIDRLVGTIRTSNHRGEIRRSAASLANMGGAGIDSLVALLGHSNHFIRWYCAGALGVVRSEKTVKPLAVLLDDPDRNVRRAAAGALGGSGSGRAVPILVAAFQDSNKGVASYAARSLGRLKAREAGPVLARGLKSGNSAAVRSSAWALGEIGLKEYIQPLVASLKGDDRGQYFIVGEALRKLGSPRAEDAFIAGLEKGAWWMKSNCAEALGGFATERSFVALREAFRTGDARLRRAAVLALSNYPSGRTESIMREALKDEDWQVRMYAGTFLEED